MILQCFRCCRCGYYWERPICREQEWSEANIVELMREKPKVCPKCKSSVWDKPREEVR